MLCCRDSILGAALRDSSSLQGPAVGFAALFHAATIPRIFHLQSFPHRVEPSPSLARHPHDVARNPPVYNERNPFRCRHLAVVRAEALKRVGTSETPCLSESPRSLNSPNHLLYAPWSESERVRKRHRESIQTLASVVCPGELTLPLAAFRV